jgi:Fe-S-cluster-containing dehydrogenase component
MKKTQLAMVIDSSSCIDCKACMMACKVENNVSEGHWRNWVKKQEPEFDDQGRLTGENSGHFQPGNCMHCDDATCVQACPTGATYKNPKDGTVLVNEELCIGCGNCIPACPYGARYRHVEKKKVDKCDFCETRRERGDLPACVVTCPTKARVFGDINNPESDVHRLLSGNSFTRVINTVTDTKPNIFYLSNTAPVNWPVKAEMPTPMKIWKAINPFMWGITGLSFLGVLVMLGKQLLVNDDPLESEETEQEGDN